MSHRASLYKLNNNMRCFEIALRSLCTDLCFALNNNMRCFEMKLDDACCTDTALVKQ